MKTFPKILERLGRKRIIMDRLDNEPYLTRYYLFLKERKWFPFNIFLHNFHKGDPDDLHDHPWPYCTIILKGGYWEHLKTGERKWRPTELYVCRSPNPIPLSWSLALILGLFLFPVHS